MFEAILKMLWVQTASSQSALERPINQARYGLLGAIVAGPVIAAGILALGGAGYFWMLSLGLSPALALLVLAALLIAAGSVAWGFFMRRGEAASPPPPMVQETSASPAESLFQDLGTLALVVARQAVEGFTEGLAARETESRPADARDSQDIDRAEALHDTGVMRGNGSAAHH
ncbi:MAG: hypothetical protein EP335_07725 [Alphaproteobacteria bacterium]|nr:MAG: hypothetical protein EP335_07725 [Alphaproteobacteria bacterium]